MKPAYDPMLTNSAVNFDTLLGNKVVIGMKHQTLEPVNEAIVELFFVTDTETGYSQDKSAQAKFGSSSDGKTVEYTLDFSENEHWKGIITGVRLDPLNMGGHYEIDYVRFLVDPEMEAKNREIIAAKEAAEAARLQAIAEGHIVVNGDAEDPDEPKAFWNNSLEVKISVDGDRKVWELVPIAGKQTWSYMYQYVNYEPGTMYEVTCDLKLTAKGNGETSGSTEIYFNPQYTGADGKFDHQKNLGWFSMGEDYKTVTFRFEIPEDAVMGKKDTFSFYSNPIEGEGVGYCVDNIQIRRVTPEELAG